MEAWSCSGALDRRQGRSPAVAEAAGGAWGFGDDHVGLEQVEEALAELGEGFGAHRRPGAPEGPLLQSIGVGDEG